MRYLLACISLLTCLVAPLAAANEPNIPPDGYTALFNGKDLSGWFGLATFDPAKWQALDEAEQLAAKEKEAGALKKHWHVENGELVNDGSGPFMTTDRNYGNFELLVDWKMVHPAADSGIYLRGIPQVQIWNPENAKQKRHGADKGSGGLWNNGPGVAGRDSTLR